jgi:hypothetical protein
MSKLKLDSFHDKAGEAAMLPRNMPGFHKQDPVPIPALKGTIIRGIIVLSIAMLVALSVEATENTCKDEKCQKKSANQAEWADEEDAAGLHVSSCEGCTLFAAV